MNLTRILLPLILGLAAITPAHAADRTRIQAILISASNEPGQTDSRLSAYEPTLRRILRFESYRFLGQGSVTLSDQAQGHISLGEGQELELTNEDSGGRGVRLRVIWLKGGRPLMETGLSLHSGVPAVLGGPGTGKGDDVYAVIVIGR